jgi:multiple sugar transport system permease protein
MKRRKAGSATGQLPHRRAWQRYPWYTFYLFLAPWLVVGFLLLTVVPMAVNLIVSFMSWDGQWGTHVRFVGLDNYTTALSDPDMLHSLRQTLIYTAITVSAGVAGSLGLAVFLNQPRRGVTLLRTIFYLPAVVSIVAAGAAFKLLFNSPNGLVDSVSMQLGGNATQWLSDQHAFYALITMSLWSLGVGIVIFLAGLQGISQEVLEAAWVDGSGKVQTFWRITVPLLSPVILFQVVTGVIGSLQAYVQAIALTPGSISGGGGGGVSSGVPPDSNTLFMVYAFEQFNSNQLFGYGCALLEIAFVVILVITIVIFRTSARWVYYETAQGGA